MTEKQTSYRVNFTMPKPGSVVNNKIIELFERHRDMGTLRHWLMALATEEAKKELGDIAAAPSTKLKPALAPAKPKKVESFADLLPDSDDSEQVTRKAKSKELEAYDSLRAEFKKSGADSTEWDEFFEKHKPLRLSDM